MAPDSSNELVPSNAHPRAGNAARSFGSEVVWRVLLSNLPFAIVLAFGAALPGPLKPAVVGSLIFLVPGLAWVDRSVGDAAVVLIRVVLASLAAAFAAWIIMVLPPGPTSRAGFLLLLAAITNVGLWRGARRGWYTAKPFDTPLARVLMVGSCVFFLQSYLGAAHFVPAMDDQDFEMQGTAYGLVHDLKPSMTTDEPSRFYFAHPLFLHLLIAESLLISNDLDHVKYFYDGALALGEPPSEPSAHERWIDAGNERWRKDDERFFQQPLLLPVRTPNIWLGALLLFPLGFLAFRMSGVFGAAIVACLLYMTLPEIYVRSSYGGYMALANFITLAGAYFYLLTAGLLPSQAEPVTSLPLARRSAFTAAFLAGWTDQKTVLLPVAATVHVALRVISNGGFSKLCTRMRQRPDVLAALCVGLGFVAGWATYIAYGLSVAPGDFIELHLRGHILNRLQLNDLNIKDIAHGEWVYPSILALWQELAEHTGFVLIVIALPAIARAGKRIREADGIFFLWIVISAIGFSLVDWRQTKHLAQFLAPFALLVSVLWASTRGRVRLALGALLTAAVIWNWCRIGMLMRDFDYIKALPIW